jgi:cytochrome P450
MARDPLRTYERLAARYGDALTVPFSPGHAFYLLSRPEHLEHVLVTHQDDYPKAFTYRPLRAFLGSGLLTSEGDLWRRHRRLVQPVFARRRLEPFAAHFAAAARRMSGRLDRLDGTADLAALMQSLTLDIVGRTLFGTDLGADAARIGQAIAALQRATLVASFLPTIGSTAATRRVMSRLPGAPRAVRTLEEVVGGTVARRRARPAPDEPRDMLDLLLAARDSDGRALSEEEIADEVATFLLAGHETTANALIWATTLLSRYPRARGRLEDEADAAPEVIDADAADKLTWTRAVLNETLRLYPPAWTIEREARVDDTIAGVPVPAGATLAVPPYLLHRRPDVWPNPEGFDPARFLPGRAERHRYAFAPFGGGRRICDRRRLRHHGGHDPAGRAGPPPPHRPGPGRASDADGVRHAPPGGPHPRDRPAPLTRPESGAGGHRVGRAAVALAAPAAGVLARGAGQ